MQCCDLKSRHPSPLVARHIISNIVKKMKTIVKKLILFSTGQPRALSMGRLPVPAYYSIYSNGTNEQNCFVSI